MANLYFYGVKPYYITENFLDHFITAALAEDVGDGDHSSIATIPADLQSQAKLLVKGNGILAGVELAKVIFAKVDPGITMDTKIFDGTPVFKDDIAFTVSGGARSILTAERLVLNCMQRMSGIATKTNHLVSLIGGASTRLLDTRKTTPNFRLLEKWAVLLGGGSNHRLGLFDMIMLKDNHVDVAGGIEKAINRTKDYLRATNRQLRIEVETRNLDEVAEVVRVGGVDVILLDNMDEGEMRDAVKLVGGKYKTEASGNINEERIQHVAACGVDFISIGSLTHSFKSLDLSLKVF